MNRLTTLVLLIALSGMIACSSVKGVAGKTNNDPLNQFAGMLIGQFSSARQAASDTNYFNISLNMTRIWSDRKDGIWLYVEQAMASRPDKPYRQRVYKLQNPSTDVFTSEIYTIKNQTAVVGLSKKPALADSLSPDKIDLKDGCTVTLRYRNGTYAGGTEGDHCPSDLRGAKYATTNITLKPGELISWDQGFDGSGKQVWGATGGGYIFIKE